MATKVTRPNSGLSIGHITRLFSQYTSTLVLTATGFTCAGQIRLFNVGIIIIIIILWNDINSLQRRNNYYLYILIKIVVHCTYSVVGTLDGYWLSQSGSHRHVEPVTWCILIKFKENETL